MNLAGITREADEFLSAQQKRRWRQLGAIERLIFRRIMDDLRQTLSETNGRITSRRGFVSLSKAIDEIFDKIERQNLKDFTRDLGKDMERINRHGVRYYEHLNVEGGDYAEINRSVSQAMRRRLGLDSEYGIMKNGYLDRFDLSTPIRDNVKKLVHKSIDGGVPMRKLEKALKARLTGTDETQGLLTSQLGGFVLDAYNQADAITNNEFAKRLDLKYFVYAGGIIETSREFCRKRNNKVFSTDEANEWASDPTLPRTKEERETGILEYEPLVDRGRYNCRHRLLYISEQEAFRRRPELAQKAIG